MDAAGAAVGLNIGSQKGILGKKLNGKINSTVLDARSSCLFCFVHDREEKKGKDKKNRIREETSIET
jgi:hypothetical protein